MSFDYVGIPQPSWDYNKAQPAVPSPWTTQEIGFFYVNKETGDDTGNANGYPTNPRRTIPSLSPGDVVIIDGTYSNTLTLGSIGTEANPIWISSLNSDGDNRAKFSGNVHYTGDWHIFNDFRFRGVDNTIDIDGTYASFMNCSFVDTDAGNGAAIKGSGDYIIIIDSVIGPSGNFEYVGPDLDHHGWLIGSRYTWCINNTIFNCQGDGVQIGGQGNTPSALHHIYLGGNTVYENLQTGIWLKNCMDVVVSTNTIYNHNNNGGGSVPANTGGQYDFEWAWWLNNTLYDADSGIQIQSDSAGSNGNRYIIGNVIRDTHGGTATNPHGRSAIVNRGGNVTCHILYNTLQNNAGGIVMPDGTNTTIHGNIIGYPTELGVPHILMPDAPITAGTINHNFYVGATQKIAWGSTTQRTVAEMVTDSTHCDNAVTGSTVNYTDEANDDLSLGATSAAIDAAGNPVQEAYTNFETRYGISIQTDFIGNARPKAGTDWDIGAYEYGGSPPAAVAPTISTHPVSETVTEPTAINLSVIADGSPSPTFQWKKDTLDITGETSATLDLDPTVTGDSADYTVVVTNSEGSVTSNIAVILVNAQSNVAPTISVHPQDATITEPTAVNLSVTASGFPTPTYQWKKDTVDITGETASTFVINSTVVADSGDYTVVVTNSEGSVTSNIAAVTVSAAVGTPPVITTQPQHTTVNEPDAMVLTIAATGDTPITYQWWQYSTLLTGETSTTLTVTPTDFGMNNQRYDCVVTNPNGATVSNEITLTVVESDAILAAPSKLFASPSAGNVVLTWIDNSDNETGFVVEVAEAPFTSFSVVTTTAADAITYTHTTATANTQLCYRVKATNGSGSSDYSALRYFNTKTNQDRNTPESRTRITTRRR